MITSNRRSAPTDINDITAPKTVVRSDNYSDVVSRREHRTSQNHTDGRRMGSNFNKQTGKNGYPDVNNTNNSGYMCFSGFMGKSSTGGLQTNIELWLMKNRWVTIWCRDMLE